MGITGLTTLRAGCLLALGRGFVAGVMGTGIMDAAGATDMAITGAAATTGGLGMGTGEATAIGQDMDIEARRLAGMAAVDITADTVAVDSTVMRRADSMVDPDFTVAVAGASMAVEAVVVRTVEEAGPTAEVIAKQE
jgi:hypothetical protein